MEDFNLAAFAKILERLTDEKGYTLFQLYQLTDIPWERLIGFFSKEVMPSFPEVIALAKVFGVQVEIFNRASEEAIELGEIDPSEQATSGNGSTGKLPMLSDDPDDYPIFPLSLEDVVDDEEELSLDPDDIFQETNIDEAMYEEGEFLPDEEEQPPQEQP